MLCTDLFGFRHTVRMSFPWRRRYTLVLLRRTLGLEDIDTPNGNF